MTFFRESGEVNIQNYPKKASTVFTNGGLVYADGSGAIQPADATSGNHMGIILTTTASTDTDYASNTVVPVDVPRPNDIIRATVSTGTLTTAMVGGYYDLTDANGIDVDNQSKNVVFIVGFVSTTEALIKINSMAGVVNVATT